MRALTVVPGQPHSARLDTMDEVPARHDRLVARNGRIEFDAAS